MKITLEFSPSGQDRYIPEKMEDFPEIQKYYELMYSHSFIVFEFEESVSSDSYSSTVYNSRERKEYEFNKYNFISSLKKALGYEIYHRHPWVNLGNETLYRIPAEQAFLFFQHLTQFKKNYPNLLILKGGLIELGNSLIANNHISKDQFETILAEPIWDEIAKEDKGLFHYIPIIEDYSSPKKPDNNLPPIIGNNLTIFDKRQTEPIKENPAPKDLPEKEGCLIM